MADILAWAEAKGLPLMSSVPLLSVDFVDICALRFVGLSGTQKRERTRRTRAAQEARDKGREQRAEAKRAAKIATMRAFTVDLQVRFERPVHCLFFM